MKNPFVSIKNTFYAAVPAIWPNRAVRRAVRYGKTLPTEWAIFFSQQPKLLALVKTGKLVA